jgi:hypothetical protein
MRTAILPSNVKSVLNKVGKTSGRSTGKQYVRQALYHFELRHGDRNYHFLIHKLYPLIRLSL